MRREPAPAAMVDALRAGIVLWCADLLLARVSDVPQWPRDLVISGVVLVAGTLTASLAGRLVPWPASLRRAASASCTALPAAALAAAIPWLRLRHEAPILAVGLASALAAGVLVAAAGTARLRQSPRLPPAVVVAAVAASAAATWIASAPPPLAISLVLGAAWALLLLLARSGVGIIIAAAAVAGLALAPFDLRPKPPESSRAEAVSPGPDIVLIVADTLRADDARDMRSYRQLASLGVAYERVQAGGSWTLPSMATLMTGNPVAVHGAGRGPGPDRTTTPISSELPTLAERLSEAGYDTGAILAMNPFLSPTYGFARGFDHFDLGDGAHHRAALPRSDDFIARPASVQLLLLAARRIQSPALHRILALGARQDARRQVADAREWLARRGERPFFLWLHLMEPHLPYRHVAEMEIPDELASSLVNATRRRIIDDPRWRERAGRDALRSVYRREIAYLDAFLVELLEALGPPRDRGRVVVLASDHGEEFYENGAFEHGHALYQGVISVPLVIAGVDPGRLRDSLALVGHLDVAPTLLELAGVDVSEDLEGISLLAPTLHDALTTQNLLYGSEPGRAVRRGDWKLLDIGGREELYDLATDPAETANLVATRPEADRLRSLLPPAGARGELAAPTRAERAALEALGYVE